MAEALDRAKKARLFVLDKMNAAIQTPRAELSPYAPRIYIVDRPDKIREVIGPGGKMIKKISAETGTQIDIEDTGEVRIAAFSGADGDARDIIRGITEDQVGRVYQGIVRRVVPCSAPSSRSRRARTGWSTSPASSPRESSGSRRHQRGGHGPRQGDRHRPRGEDQLSRKQALPGYVPSEDDGASDRGATAAGAAGAAEDAGRPPAAGAVAALTGSRASFAANSGRASASVAVSGAMGERA